MAQTKALPKQQQTRKLVAGKGELRGAIIDIVSHAERTLSLLTPNLEPEIYEHDDFLVALKRFVLGKSFARVRVLITEPERAIKTGNQLVQMGQRLSSHIELRNLAADLRPERQAYCISDNDSVLYRADYSTQEGMVAMQAPEIAKLYLTEFDEIWQAS
jgi:hypothetical protein